MERPGVDLGRGSRRQLEEPRVARDPGRHRRPLEQPREGVGAGARLDQRVEDLRAERRELRERQLVERDRRPSPGGGRFDSDGGTMISTSARLDDHRARSAAGRGGGPRARVWLVPRRPPPRATAIRFRDGVRCGAERIAPGLVATGVTSKSSCPLWAAREPCLPSCPGTGSGPGPSTNGDERHAKPTTPRRRDPADPGGARRRGGHAGQRAHPPADLVGQGRHGRRERRGHAQGLHQRHRGHPLQPQGTPGQRHLQRPDPVRHMRPSRLPATARLPSFRTTRPPGRPRGRTA